MLASIGEQVNKQPVRRAIKEAARLLKQQAEGLKHTKLAEGERG